MVCRREEMAHLRASVRTPDSNLRERHAGVAVWLQQLIDGTLEREYRLAIEHSLTGRKEKLGEGGEPGGSDYMNPDTAPVDRRERSEDAAG